MMLEQMTAWAFVRVRVISLDFLCRIFFISRKYTVTFPWFYESFLSPYSGWAFLGLLTDGWAKSPPPPHLKICRIFPTMMKRGTMIPYLKYIQKIYKSRDTPLSSADISVCSPVISNFFYIEKCRYWLHFNT